LPRGAALFRHRRLRQHGPDAEIVRTAGVNVLEFRRDGCFPKKRNWVPMNHTPATPWVLFLDADELVDDAFCYELTRAISDEAFESHWLNYTDYFLGHRLKHRVPQRKLALVRVGKAIYERIDEDTWSKLDMEIHEHPVVGGNVSEIRVPIEHNNFRGIEKFLDRHRDYALWEACRILLLERQKTASSGQHRRRPARTLAASPAQS